MEEQQQVIKDQVAFNFEFNAFQQWEIAFIYAFAVTFNPHEEVAPSFYRLPEFTPKELEIELQKEESSLIHQIICSCVGNILNRKNSIDTFKIALQQLVTDKIKTFDIDLESNPLSKVTFPLLPIDVKLYILHSMIEWQLQDSLAIKSIIEHFNSTTPKNQWNPIKSYPIGVDSKKRNYWQFGESCWIWREKPHVKPTCEWETVCKNKQDLEQLVSTLSSTNRAEKALMNVIKTEIYELADKEERKILRKERAELRKLIPVEISITPTQLRSRGNRKERVRYNYDEEEEEDIYGIEDNNNDKNDDDFEQEEEELNTNKRTSRRNNTVIMSTERPTRWSNRLNKVDNTNNKMDIDTEQDNMDTTPTNVTIETPINILSMETSPYASDMDTTPSQSIMDTSSRSQSVIDIMDTSRPQSVMEQ